MSFPWAKLFGGLLATGESLEPLFIHNAKSQQVAVILTTDANALFAEFTQQGVIKQPQP